MSQKLVAMLEAKCLNYQWCGGSVPLPEYDYCIMCCARLVATYDSSRRYVAATVNEIRLVEDGLEWAVRGYM